MKKYILPFVIALMPFSMMAQHDGGNTNMGTESDHYKSLYEKVTNIEKKHEAFNVYLNFASSFQSGDAGNGDWQSAFRNKQLRLEIKGNIGDHLFYRLRHRLNKATDAKSEDNFAKATDIMMAGWKFNDKWSIQAGKMCQIWGGFEFDENPMYIYQYSDMVDNMDNFMAGVTVSYQPVPSQEIAVMVSDAYNGTLYDEIGNDYLIIKQGNNNMSERLKASNHPLTYIVNWNGSFFDGMLNTRWAYGVQTQADGMRSQMLTLGQQLNLPKLQWYIDYMGAFDDFDRLGIASRELGWGNWVPSAPSERPIYTNVDYHSLITKMNWQFAPQWNLMLKGMYETASVDSDEAYSFSNYRHAYGYIGSLEYYPVKDQDLRVFLSYVGRKYNYSKESLSFSTTLGNYHTNRIEIGFMYRIKAF